MKFSCFKIFFLQRVEGRGSIPERKSLHVDSEIIMELMEKSLKEKSYVENLSSEDSFNRLLEPLAEYIGIIDRSISRLEECVELLKREMHYKTGLRFRE